MSWRDNNCLGMYRLCHIDEGTASKLGVASDCSSVENVFSVSMNDVTGGIIANVNGMNFSTYFVCSISL